MRILFPLWLVLVGAMVPIANAADFKIEKVNDSQLDPAALTISGIYGQCINGQSFQQDAITSFNGWQYVTWYDGQRHVCVARRELPAGEWDVIRLADYKFNSQDAHNIISLGICPKDGTIHLAFDHHISPLHYRISQKQAATDPGKVKWSPALFGPVTNRLDRPVTDLTYPAFLTTPEGNLQLHYRFGTSGAGQRWVVDYDGATGVWHDNRQIDTGDGDFHDQFNESHNRNAYPNGFDFGPDGRLHYTWVWRENTQGANHDLCYSYSDDRGFTWHNNAGDLVNKGDSRMIININTPGITVAAIPRSRSLMNQQAQAVDSNGRVHVLIWHARDNYKYQDRWWVPEKSAYFHYWRNDRGDWQRSEIPSQVGNRPKLMFDEKNNLCAIFTVNRDPSHWAHDLYYNDGELRIAAATAASHWTDWKIIYRDPGHYMNELLADKQSFKSGNVLSIIAQEPPNKPNQSTPFHVLDYKVSVAD